LKYFINKGLFAFLLIESVSFTGCKFLTDKKQSKTKEFSTNPTIDLEAATKSFYQGRATVDTNRNLSEVLEFDKIKDSCKNYFKISDPSTGELRPAHSNDKASKDEQIRCGKLLFIYGGPIKTKIGVPELLIKPLLETMPSETGQSFENLGFIPDPNDPGYPVGLSKHSDSYNHVLPSVNGKSRMITCAACHMGKLQDGRYSIGYPNENLDIGKFNLLTMYPLWLADHRSKDESHWPKEVIEYYEKLGAKTEKIDCSMSATLANAKGNIFERVRIFSCLKVTDLFYSIIGEVPPPPNDLRSYVRGGKGVFNPMSPMLSVVNGPESYMTMPQIWAPNQDPFKSDSAQKRTYGTLTPVDSFEKFIKHALIFVTLNPDFAKPQVIIPLKAYMEQLNTPPSPITTNSELVSKGKSHFEKNCLTCHSGEGGAGANYSAEGELGLPTFLFSPFKNFNPANKRSKETFESLQKVANFPTTMQGVQSRKISGIWSRTLFTRNGQVKSLEDLFCTQNQRNAGDIKDPLTTGIHIDLCKLDSEQKSQIIEFIKSWN
jgi:hypothetical protein